MKIKRKRSPRATSGASDDNKKLFSSLYAGFTGKEFGYDDIELYAQIGGIAINMTNMRSNASDYVKHGYLDRPTNGRFIITEKGKKYFGISDNNPPIAPKHIRPEDTDGYQDSINRKREAERRREIENEWAREQADSL